MGDWRILALNEARAQNVEADIVLATIEAETNGTNEMGDNGNAFGYGQVWLKWHRDNFEYAAKRLNISLPSTTDGIRNLVLSNDNFSMIVAVKTVKNVWIGQHKNWHNFTLAYVGPRIPKSDYNRRERIWLKYHNGGEITNIVASDYVSNNGGNTSLYSGTQSDIPLDTYDLIKNSTSMGNIIYGRRYRVLISNEKGTALDVSNLRCTFNITKTMLMQPNYCEVTIYNLNAETENSIIKEGMRIIVEAGYLGDQYGVIFDGDILQPIRDKEDGVTYKLTLNSLDGDKFLNFGFANFSLVRGQSLRNVTDQVTNNAKNPAQLGDIASSLSQSKLTRGKAVFGLAKDVLRQIAQSHSATFYVDNGKVNIIKADDIPRGEIIELSPKTGLIDTPSQTEYGVNGKCLLNPRIKLNSIIHIDNSLVRAQKVELNKVVRTLDADGLYRVTKIIHKGDTRGNDWYTEFETVSQAGNIPSMLGNASMNPW